MRFNKFLKTAAVMLILTSVLAVNVFADTAYKTITVDKNGDYIETQNAYNQVETIQKIGDEILNNTTDMEKSGER